MQDFDVRRADPDDLEPLLPLVQQYRVYYEQPPDEMRERAFIESHLRNGTACIYLAHAGNAPVGFMQLFRSYSTVHLGPAWILEDLFVAPEYRGRGIAAALLDRAMRHANDDGAAGMFLETAYDNHTAQRVYERAGWTRENRYYKYNAPRA